MDKKNQTGYYQTTTTVHYLATRRRLGWIDAPHTPNFENLKSLQQTQESKKCKITFEFFVKMLDGFNFG
jgi:L,D-peptidoglycan transpeptidase YkuD (ErfK/YbiS/YcfS/YnhG family)